MRKILSCFALVLLLSQYLYAQESPVSRSFIIMISDSNSIVGKGNNNITPVFEDGGVNDIIGQYGTRIKGLILPYSNYSHAY